MLVVGHGFNALVGLAKRAAPPTRLLVATVPAGALAVSALALWQPRIVGNGQVAIGAVLAGGMTLPALVVLLLAKACGVAVGLVTGSTGGLLTPSLAIGACVGGAIGVAAGLDPSTTVLLVVMGAACVLALNQRAPFFGALFAIELTRVPLPFALATGAGVGLVWCVELLGGRLAARARRGG